ncbi:NAD-dependent protein deacetylase [Catellatospora citrea]|uniref:NAD-dependent protein deacetylase n=2 Tax=Catellatospora citrea TaxID=53366 RepID=A0A8J3P1S6_9ACTN|nr:NAD-dependent protein deacetylase [Catellatospora citrea]GIG00318.1 NAD-dependent protein deacetylase [Catellatospora citrea]
MHATKERVAELAAMMAEGGVAVLSGAGLSTESGIPDYRGPDGVQRRHAPMTYQAFTREPQSRVRYWARSHLGWRTIARASPNTGHQAVAALQRHGLLSGIVTQNVDGLHQAAGAEGVIELHGSLDRVICLGCGDVTPRAELDRRLHRVNPGFSARITAVHPDGDVEFGDDELAGFGTVDCAGCEAGMLKPDVVFFGETVPPARVQQCFDLVERSRLLLVLGSSLTVMSGRRFVIRAVKLGIPVAIVNRGTTRSDAQATLTVDAPLGQVLPTLVHHLAGHRLTETLA